MKSRSDRSRSVEEDEALAGRVQAEADALRAFLAGRPETRWIVCRAFLIVANEWRQT